MMQPQTDRYAAGMVHTQAQDAEVTAGLNLFQFQLIERYLGQRILELGREINFKGHLL